MAIRFIKSKQDIYEVFKDQTGNINPGITGEVYTNLENLGTAGEKIMYQQQKGVFGVACSAGFASCKTFGKQPKHPCFGA